MDFFLNKEKDQVMKTKEKLCQKRLFRNLLAPCATSSMYRYFLYLHQPPFIVREHCVTR